MIKYLGSKKKLLPHIHKFLQDNDIQFDTVLDVFAGTSRVGYFFKQQGYSVFSNDLNYYAYVLANSLIVADSDKYTEKAQNYINRLNKLKGKSGYFTKKFCIESMYFTEKNGKKIDAIREEIESIKDETLKHILLTSLMLAADKVDSTCGVQMAYLKQYATRAHNDIKLILPPLLPNNNNTFKAFHGKAEKIGSKIRTIDNKNILAYLDPPYNQHSYLGNYHIWESLCLWDKPDTYGVANKRIDCKERKSNFNKKNHCLNAFEKTLEQLTECKIFLVSFNNEGYISKEEIVRCLSKYGNVKLLEIEYDRYIGARIGIYNPSGDKVGKIKNTKNIEYCFLVELKN